MAWLVSTYVVCERLSVMHKQVSDWTVNFCPNSPVCPQTGISDWFTPPQWKTSDLRWPKFTPVYPPTEKLQIWDDQSLLRFTPLNWKTSDLRWSKFTLVYPPKTEKLQIWDDQSLLWFTTPPPTGKLQIWDDQSLLQFTPPPKTEKLQIWDDQSLLRFTPPPPNWKTRRSYVETNL